MKQLAPVVLLVALTACMHTRSLAPVPSPARIDAYLQAHPRAVLRITDSTGHGRWLYEATMTGDTLRGFRTNAVAPRQPMAFPVSQLVGVEAQEFSAVRTVGFFVGIGTVIALIALTMPPPDY